MGKLVAGASIQKMLDEAFYLVTDSIYTHGDGPLRNGQYFSSLEQTGVRVSNANNHQTTWGVLAAALTALSDYMSLTAFGEATFTIHDGGNLVGQGFVELVQSH